MISLGLSNGLVTATINGTLFSFDAAQVTSVIVNGLGGDDSLTSDSLLKLPITFNGEAGNDAAVFNASVGDDTIAIGPTFVSDGAQILTLTGTESLVVNTGSGDDTVLISGTPAATNVTTGDGDDSVVVGNGSLGNGTTGISKPLSIDGGTGVNDIRVNDSQSTSADTYSISGSSVSRSSIPMISFTGFNGGLTVEAGSGANFFNVIPDSLVAILIDGGPPTPPAIARDQLHIDVTATTNSHVSQTGTGRGLWTFDNRQPVYFTGIERAESGGLTALIDSVAPNPRTTAVDQVNITFSAPVSNFTLAALSLTRNGGPNLLTGAQTLTTSDNVTWTVGNLASISGMAGNYSLGFDPLTPDSAEPHDGTGSPLANNPAVAWRTDASVVARQIFYNHSYWNDPTRGFTDDNAIDTSKVALTSGQQASFASYTGSSKGINGIMIDIARLPSGTLAASDFTFKIGNNNTPGGWTIAPAPTTILVRRGAGVGASDRAELIWADNAIQNTWLQVTVKADAATGLSAADVFYFGNAIGESGNNPADAAVNSGDIIAVRDHPTSFGNPALVTSPYDFNHDSAVNATDMIIARDHPTTSVTVLKLILPTGAGSAVPAVVVAATSSSSSGVEPLAPAPAPPAAPAATVPVFRMEVLENHATVHLATLHGVAAPKVVVAGIDIKRSTPIGDPSRSVFCVVPVLDTNEITQAHRLAKRVAPWTSIPQSLPPFQKG